MKVNNNESPINFGFGGNITSMIQAAANRAPGQSQTAAMLGGSLSGQAKALFNASQGIDQQQQSTGTTGGALSNAAASVVNTGQTPSATSTTSGALAGATPDAGTPSGVNTQSGEDVESRITALEQNAPSNTLGSAQPVFNPQAQQAAQGIYGSIDQRQNAVNATPLFQKGYTKTTKKIPKKQYYHLDPVLDDNMKMVLEKHRRQNNQPIQEDSKILDSKFKKQNVTKNIKI